MHFGLETYLPTVEYLAFIVVFLLTVFWRPILGIFFLLPLIPLQTIRYRMNDFPLGGSVVGIMLLGVLLGLLLRGKPILPKTPWTKLLLLYGIFTFVSLSLGSLYLRRPLPFPGDPRFGVWQDYMTMPTLLLVTAAVAPSRRQMQAMILVMCLTTFALDAGFWNVVSGRDYSVYSNDLREASGMGYAGSNGLAAFEAQIAIFLLAIAAFERKLLPRISYYSLAGFSALCLMYSLSRGGYLAFLAGYLFIGFLKDRKLLILLALFLASWTSLVPSAVQQRVLMTYDQRSGSIDNSSETRLSLWENAMRVWNTNIVLGAGFNTYEYMELNRRTDGGTGYYGDTHNFFVKVLVETGALGLLLFLLLVAKALVTGYRLFRKTTDPFLASLGFGLIAWLVTCLVANCFGDRWTFLQVNGYMWVLGGLVCQGLVLEQGSTSTAMQEVSAPGSSQVHSVFETRNYLQSH